MKLILDLNALAVDSFEVNVASDPSQWTAAAGDEEGVTVVEGYSHDVTQPHVCRTTTTF
jgi:hypothetical protein